MAMKKDYVGFILNIAGRGSVLSKVMRRVIVLAALSVFITAIHMGWIPGLSYKFQKLSVEIQAFYGVVGSLLGLLLSFRINFSMGRWSDGMVAERQLLGTAKQIISSCAYIDDSFSPVTGKGNPAEVGPHADAFDRTWGCMSSEIQPGRGDESPKLRYRRQPHFEEMATSCALDHINRRSDAAGAILRIRHLVLAVCELTGKHVRYDGDLSDLKAKGRFDDITYQMLTSHPLVVPAENMQQCETGSPVEDGFRTATRINLCVMWLREELVRTLKACITLDVFVLQMNEKIDTLAAAANSIIRIGRTPMPFVYAQFTKIVTWSYVLSAPFYLVAVAGNYSAIFVFVMAFYFLGLDEIAVQLEEPFGTDETDINLAGDCEFLARETACLVSARFARDFEDSHPIIYNLPVEYLNHASVHQPSTCCYCTDGGDAPKRAHILRPVKKAVRPTKAASMRSHTVTHEGSPLIQVGDDAA